MKNISLGQYYPGNSAVHRADPRMKLILSFLYIICSFLCSNILSFVLLLLSAVLLIFVSRIPMGLIMRSIKPILFILAFTVVSIAPVILDISFQFHQAYVKPRRIPV